MPASTADSIPIAWTPRAEPLEPLALAAAGADGQLLARRVLALEDDVFERLEGLAVGEWLILLGQSDRLPWIPGVRYFGKDPDAPLLLLPTALQPSVPVALVQRALAAQFAALRPPLVVLVPECRVLSAQPARALDRGRLREWIEEGS